MSDNISLVADGDAPTGVSLHSGFPNPAADVAGRRTPLALDLNKLLIQHPASTFAFRISGESWSEQGIFDGDVALIDRALSPRSADLVLSWEHDSFTLRPYRSVDGYWGVVSSIIHQRRT